MDEYIEIKNLIEFTINLVESKLGIKLNSIQQIVLAETLQNPLKKYEDVAEEFRYSERYLRNTVAPHLWSVLTEALGEKVHKRNCLFVLRKQFEQKDLVKIDQAKSRIELPFNPVPGGSEFYISRFEIELKCLQEIKKANALIRLKSPKGMGKTSLINQIFFKIEQQEKTSQKVYLSLNSVEAGILSSTEKFLRWFCVNVSRQLKLDNNIEQYWDNEIGVLVSCTVYFETYLLENIEQPFILVIDELNQIFDYPDLARDFLALLRFWHEESREVSHWQKLRLILSYSTDCYLNLDINKSPFNVGLPINITPFTAKQVEDLAKRYSISVMSEELGQLMQLLGGFPYLVRPLLYYSVIDQISITDLLKTASTEAGIFREHLYDQLEYLKNNPDLAKAFYQVLKSQQPIPLDPQNLFKLNSVGLISLERNFATVSCQLYQQYFNQCNFCS